MDNDIQLNNLQLLADYLRLKNEIDSQKVRFQKRDDRMRLLKLKKAVCGNLNG